MQITTVNKLIFYGSFSQVLDYVPANSQGNWTPEWQGPYNFSVSQPGHYKLWFILLMDGTPFQGTTNQDYAGTNATARFLDMVGLLGCAVT